MHTFCTMYADETEAADVKRITLPLLHPVCFTILQFEIKLVLITLSCFILGQKYTSVLKQRMTDLSLRFML